MPSRSYQCVDEKLGELATLHVLGELGGERRRLFEAHLEACAACAEHVQSMEDLMRAASSLGPGRLWRLGARPSAGRLSVAAGAIIAAAVVALIVAVGISQQRASTVALLGQVRSVQTRLAKLEEQNEEILRTLETESAVDAPRVQDVRGARFVFPPNL